ncbi:double-stranded RNA-binding protein 4-like [Quercus robur]|uniref:double-stranded RNA-binding protein 4-like n=1 Tax=Quercus robur TaxID=38942 RepID=UPI002162BCAD|nr:double-stranded RNA-binding protein 4-like [Quercus robur]
MASSSSQPMKMVSNAFPQPQPQLSVQHQPQPQLPSQPQLRPPPPSTSARRLDPPLMYKNRLQEYTQRSAIPQPLYQTMSEEPPNARRFRSTVEVDGATYTSPNTFLHKKAAEQDVAKIALEHISKRIRDEGCPLIHEDTVFCKAILNEFALKMNLDKPTFNTVQPEGLLPVFISSTVFNGVCYTGTHGRNKKEAEQLAARAVIVSLLGNSGSGTILTEIIKSKEKLYAALHKVKSVSHATISAIPQSVEVQVASPGASSGTQVIHELKIPKPEPSTQLISAQTSSQAVNLPIEFVPAVLPEPSGVGPSSSKKRRKNKNKANKKLRSDTQFSIAEMPVAQAPMTQAPPCSVGLTNEVAHL